MPSFLHIASITSLLLVTASISAQAINIGNVEGTTALHLAQLERGGVSGKAAPNQAPAQKNLRQGSPAKRSAPAIRQGRSVRDGGTSARRRSGREGVTVRRPGGQVGGSPRAYRQTDRGSRKGVRFYWGPGAEFYFYDGYYHGDCAWLRRKARATGSQYWRIRYRQCRAL